MKQWKKITAWICVLGFIWSAVPIHTKAQVSITSPSAILMEASTGQIIFEQNAAERRSPASITKIMTMLLTFEMLDQGKISLEDQVVTSEYASSMGGSQVFLAMGEKQTLDTMLKCIAVASANDASVAVAEHVAGSESAFVEQMNKKAAELGMADTHFEDCCGLTDSDGHYTTAKDVAIMSRELITKYPQVYNYTQIWMEDITHETAQGTSRFGLSSTNRLLKQYQYTTGLKTGSTSKAKFCISATASKDGMDLIAVVMGAPDYKTRFGEAQTLLTYGFGACSLYADDNTDSLPSVPVERGVTEQISLVYENDFHYLDTSGKPKTTLEKRLEVPERVEAPLEQGAQVGWAKYYLDGAEVGSVALLSAEEVAQATYFDYLKKIFKEFLLN